jgi:small-conductance mechanosensitive channel
MFKQLEKSLARSLSGGARSSSGMNGISPFGLFVATLVLLLVKVFIVMICYNTLMPRLLMSYNVDMSNYRSLTFTESILLVVLFNSLFN